MTNPRLLRLALLLGALGALGATAASAQGGAGDLLVAPTRVVLEGRQRTAEITLVNTGATTATYRITFVDLRMNEMGGTAEIDAASAQPGEQFAAALIRYSPRQVVLEPKVAQTVRLQLRLPAALPPGEYRSHLVFRALPPPDPAPASAAATGEFSVAIRALYGISIPVIVRHGETAATATLSALQLVPAAAPAKAPTLRMRIHRSGNRSIYGDLTATFVPASGKPTVVGIANGVAVYTPNAVRSAGLTLRLPPGVVLRKGRLHLAYTSQSKGNETIAEADLLVP